MKNILYLFIFSLLFLFCCSQAIFAETKITDSQGNTCIYDNASHLVEIRFKNGIKSIRQQQMENQKYLRQVSIPPSVEYIGPWAFQNCTSLIGVFFDDKENSKLREIDNYAFSNCYFLGCISLPKSLKIIGQGAFINCESLENLKIPNSVTSIGPSAFGVTRVFNSNARPVPHIYYNGPASDKTEHDLPKQLHKWGAARRN